MNINFIKISQNIYLEISTNVDMHNIDYYTNFNVELIIEDTKYNLLNENILYIKNILEKYIENINNYILDNRLLREDLGIDLNNYYYFLNYEINNFSLIVDENGNWIGEKYNCFCNNKYATWIYKFDNKIYLEVTPLFDFFKYDANDLEYKIFIRKYKRVIIVELDFEILLETYNKLDTIYKDIINIKNINN